MEFDAVGLGLPVFAGGGGGGVPAVLVGFVAFFLAPARASSSATRASSCARNMLAILGASAWPVAGADRTWLGVGVGAAP